MKGEYRRHDALEGAIGVKIAANDVDRVVAGTRLMVLEPEDDPDHIKEEVMQDLANVEMLLSRDARGVFVQASTIGSLEALLGFLRSQDPPIPVSAFGLGPVHKKEIMQASIALEHDRECVVFLLVATCRSRSRTFRPTPGMLRSLTSFPPPGGT